MLEKFKPVERFWILTRGQVKSNGVERAKQQQGFETKVAMVTSVELI